MTKIIKSILMIVFVLIIFMTTSFFIYFDTKEPTIKEVIIEKEVPVEVIKEVVKEVPIEVIKEVPVEKIVERVVEIEKVIEKEIRIENRTVTIIKEFPEEKTHFDYALIKKCQVKTGFVDKNGPILKDGWCSVIDSRGAEYNFWFNGDPAWYILVDGYLHKEGAVIVDSGTLIPFSEFLGLTFEKYGE